jgi:type III restriction enzyme
VVIVDEAHNARTDLSFATLGGVLPSCIIEFTATPALKKNPSNVLHNVSAMELKAESMVKLPLRVFSRHPSQRAELLSEAISTRADLEKAAILEGQATGEYLRPILLFQAESVDACEPLRERLVAEFAIPKDQIKISVGSKNELPDGDEIADPSCPIRFVITVQRLREGWDCPFAYVLCSLRDTRSATAIEQIVGRILRLPQAREKANPSLNCSYAFSISQNLGEVLNELREALVQNGFTRAEAQSIVLPPAIQPTLGAQPQTVQFSQSEIDAGTVQARVAELGSKVVLDKEKRQITILVPLDEDETATLAACATTPEAKAKVTRAADAVRAAEMAFGGSGKTREPSPYERREHFRVPLLCVREGQMLFEFESTFLIEQPWNLSAKDASLAPEYNPLERPLSYSGVLDIGKAGNVETELFLEPKSANFVGQLHQQMLALDMPSNWTSERLVSWLDAQIPHTDIPPGESGAFLGKVIRGLMAKYGIEDIDVLAADRYRLRDEVERCIQRHREAERGKAFQGFLLPDSDLVVSEESAMDFGARAYEPSWVYEGDFQFKKHFYGPKVGELIGKTSAGKVPEEFRCAQYLDSLPEVEYWVRNLARKSSSFRLQTSKDWFYPDFVCKLTDGRVLVVEYKGAHLYDGAEEKRLIGTVWASRSGGKCLFVMPSDNNLAVIERAIRG